MNNKPKTYFNVNFSARKTDYSSDPELPEYPAADSIEGTVTSDEDSTFDEDQESQYFADPMGYVEGEVRSLADENSNAQEFPADDIDYDDQNNKGKVIKEAEVNIILETSLGTKKEIAAFTVQSSDNWESLIYKHCGEESVVILAHVINSLLDTKFDKAFFLDSRNSAPQLPIGSYNRIRNFIKDNGYELLVKSEGTRPQLIPLEILTKEREQIR